MTELIPSVRTGTVVAFDAAAGLGEVAADDGARLAFHCIVIADGSRTIEVGARVSFDVVPKLGRWEASSIRPA
jgi:cold shock CspA family protein